MQFPDLSCPIVPFFQFRISKVKQIAVGLLLSLIAVPGLQTSAQTLIGERVELTSGSPNVRFKATSQNWSIVGLSTKLAFEDETGLPGSGDDIFAMFSGARENSLIIDTGGLVGLGTRTPLALLDVRSEMGMSYVRIDPDAPNASIDVLEETDPAELLLETLGATKSAFVTLMAPNTEFAILANGNNSQPKLLIKDQVNGKNAITIFASPLNNNTLTLRDGNVGFQLANPSHPFHMRSGAHCTTGGVWTNACSRALKDNIKNLDAKRARSAFTALNPVTYSYKNAPNEKHVGFIAEDVPEIVATSDRKGLATLDVVAVLTKVMQEQDTLILNQQKEIQDHRNRIQLIDRQQEEQAELLEQLMNEMAEMRAQLVKE